MSIKRIDFFLTDLSCSSIFSKNYLSKKSGAKIDIKLTHSNFLSIYFSTYTLLLKNSSIKNGTQIYCSFTILQTISTGFAGCAN